jgi:PKD repeat protein
MIEYRERSPAFIGLLYDILLNEKGACSLRKYYLIVLVIFLLVFANVTMGINSDSKLIPINRLLQVQVNLPEQKQTVIVPTNPLDFDTTLEWEVNIVKKSLASEKDAAFFTIEDLGSPVKQLERKIISGTGKLTIPKGTQFKITVYAGEYSRLITREGATVQAKLKYAEAQIQYSQGDKPYQFNLEAVGPKGLNNWSWMWGSNDSTTGNKVSHQFSSEGKFPVIVEGKGKTLSGVTSQKFYFDLEVPPLIIMDPKVQPLKGPVELNVTAKVNAIVNYGQKASYTWNFGNGVELSGPEVGSNLVKPGKYQLLLIAKVADYTFQRNWLIEVQPLSIIPNPVVTPLTGPVPLDITGTVNPNINGGPTQLKFSWEIGKEVVEGTELKHSFTEPGDYQMVFRTTDKLHPGLVIPDTVFLVKALPPQMDIKPTTSITKGIIPLSVNFEPHLTVLGSPVELSYRWDFGDGETSDLEKPNHIFKKSGIYDVQLTINDRLHQGNLVSVPIKVEVLPPEMKITVTPSVSRGLAPLIVNFNSQMSVTGSPCDPQYLWDFGDGETSVEQNPVHTFKQDGKYMVALEAKDWLHPASSVKTTVMIDVKMPKIRLTATVTPVVGTAPLTINCQAWADQEGSTNAKMKFVWDFGDGVTTEGMDQKHSFEKPGTYNVLVFVEDQILGITERKTFKVVVK